MNSTEFLPAVIPSILARLDHTPMPPSPRIDCVLLALPPEIRGCIYESIFDDDDDCIIQLYSPYSWSRSYQSVCFIPLPYLNILLLCRQIYREAQPMVYRRARTKFGNATDIKHLVQYNHPVYEWAKKNPSITFQNVGISSFPSVVMYDAGEVELARRLSTRPGISNEELSVYLTTACIQEDWRTAKSILEQMVPRVEEHDRNLYYLGFCASAQKGQHSMVQRFLKIGTPLYLTDVPANRSLIYQFHPLRTFDALSNACCQDQEIIVETLLHAGAEVNSVVAHHIPAIHMAARYGKIHIFNLLLANGADPHITRYSSTTLHEAAIGGNTAIARMLLNRGLDPHAKRNSMELWMLKETCLTLASGRGNTEMMELFLLQNVDLNGLCGSALKVACYHGHEGAVKLLLQRGAALECMGPDNRSTALICAARGGHQNIVQLLLEKGAKVNIRTHDHNTALVAAAESGSKITVQILVDNGADLDLASERGTALQVAIDPGYLGINDSRLDIIEFLLNRGASPNVNAWIGRPILLNSGCLGAATRKSPEVRRLLRQHGHTVEEPDIYPHPRPHPHWPLYICENCLDNFLCAETYCFKHQMRERSIDLPSDADSGKPAVIHRKEKLGILSIFKMQMLRSILHLKSKWVRLINYKQSEVPRVD